MTADHTEKLDRIREVAMTVSEPRNAGEIAAAAGVSRNTAEKYLRQLVAARTLATVEVGRETRYRPDPVTQYLDQVRDLVEDHSKAELTAELAAMCDEMDAWASEYGVDAPDALRASVGDGGRSAAARERRVRDAEDWAYYRERVRLVQQALDLYDSLSAAGTSSRSVP